MHIDRVPCAYFLHHRRARQTKSATSVSLAGRPPTRRRAPTIPLRYTTVVASDTRGSKLVVTDWTRFSKLQVVGYCTLLLRYKRGAPTYVRVEGLCHTTLFYRSHGCTRGMQKDKTKQQQQQPHFGDECVPPSSLGLHAYTSTRLRSSTLTAWHLLMLQDDTTTVVIRIDLSRFGVVVTLPPTISRTLSRRGKTPEVGFSYIISKP